MPTLNELEKDRYEILSNISQAYGEITDDQEALLAIINKSITAKYTTYVDMVQRKDFNAEIKRLEGYKKEIDSTIKRYKSTQEYIHQKLHERGQVKVTNAVTGQDSYVLPTMVVANTNIEEDKVDKLVGKYIIEVDAKQYEQIVEATPLINVKRKILIGDLTDEQKDEFQTLRPSVKVTKTKPKDWSD